MNKSSHKWKTILMELGHPHVESWDGKTFSSALFRGSKERKELLNWLAPKILECSGNARKFPGEIALPDVYSQFVRILKVEIPGFIDGSLLKDKQVEIWSNIFWKMDVVRDKTHDANMEEIRSPEKQVLIDNAQQALRKAEDTLNEPLSQLAQSTLPSEDNREVVSQDELIDGIKKFFQEAKHLKLDPAAGNLEVDLTVLKTLSEMAEAMKRM